MTTTLEPSAAAAAPAWDAPTVILPMLPSHPSHPIRQAARRIVDAIFAKLQRRIDDDYARMHAELDALFETYAALDISIGLSEPAPLSVAISHTAPAPRGWRRFR